MTTDCLNELQKAVFTALDGDATISSQVTAVYSHVTQGAIYPYIKISSIESSDWSTITTTGIKSNISFDVYSQERGNKELLDILVEIKRILDGTILAMTGCTMVSSHYISTSTTQLSDGLTWKGSVGFRFLVQKD